MMMKQIFKLIHYSLLLSLFCQPMCGQEHLQKVKSMGALSLDSCKQLALKHNHQIRMAQLGENKAQATLWAMRTNFLPKVTAEGFIFYTQFDYQKDLSIPPLKVGTLIDPQLKDPILKQTPKFLHPAVEKVLPVLKEKLWTPIAEQKIKFPSYQIDFRLRDCYFGRINVDQPIFMGGKIIAANAMAKIGTRASKYKRSLKEEEVLLETEQAFYLYIKAEELKKVAQSYKITIEEVKRLTSNAIKTGMRSKNDELKVEIELSKANLKVEQAKHGVLLAQMNLNQIIGRELTAPINIKQELSSYKFAPSQETSLDITARKEYALLSEKVELKRQEKLLALSEFLPRVGLRGSYAYSRAGKLNGDSFVDTGSLSATLMVSIPLFHWGESYAKVKAAKLEQQIAQEEMKHLSEKMTLELQQKTNFYNESIMELQLCERVLDQAKEHKRVMYNRYEAGLEKLVDYLEAETLYNKAMADLVITRTKLALSRSALLKAQGQLNWNLN